MLDCMHGGICNTQDKLTSIWACTTAVGDMRGVGERGMGLAWPVALISRPNSLLSELDPWDEAHCMSLLGRGALCRHLLSCSPPAGDAEHDGWESCIIAFALEPVLLEGRKEPERIT